MQNWTRNTNCVHATFSCVLICLTRCSSLFSCLLICLTRCSSTIFLCIDHQPERCSFPHHRFAISLLSRFFHHYLLFVPTKEKVPRGRTTILCQLQLLHHRLTTRKKEISCCVMIIVQQVFPATKSQEDIENSSSCRSQHLRQSPIIQELYWI